MSVTWRIPVAGHLLAAVKELTVTAKGRKTMSMGQSLVVAATRAEALGDFDDPLTFALKYEVCLRSLIA
jgi:hypothetical protein